MNFLERKYYQLLSKFLNNKPNQVEAYLKTHFYLKNKRHLNLEQPKEFADKIQWLKLNLYKQDYQKYVDKFEVRDFIKEKIGEKYLNDLIEVYDNVEAINLNDLPNKFVLKGTHGSGYNIIVKDKAQLNWDDAKLKLKKYINTNYFNKYKEYIYKDIKPRIIAEKYLDQLDNDHIVDYKFMCFHGVPKYIHVKTFEDDRIKETYYTIDWKKIEPEAITQNHLKQTIEKPENFEEMVRLSKILSKDFIFIRVDLYAIGSKVYFGELTFFHKGGMKRNYIESLNKKMGNLIKLPIQVDA
ncbi:ATP-grasp fold amidoligase family protein [Winogradskyella sp. PG-2]|uniref:ATP-grasp fold amidoligase family protein n=1 Tax=Winogradskyella sp. PG-2 TaxID=754409 RepID=UPI0004586B13|nr:ATP-grasp fold amidoligase family protein [Winogradskyella sp. PG-2]BAO74521.1 glycosyltransferase [Winogradskyella sp. PG-2]